MKWGPLFAERRISRTLLACLMILVAALGATVAYWIARSEQGSARLHRQLTRAQMVEISLRQAIVGDWGFRSSLEERQRAHRSRAANLQDNADRVRYSDPQQAGQLEMLAQQELMLSRLTGTLLTPFRRMGPGANVQQQVDNRVTEELAVLGFATASVKASPADEPPPSPAGAVEPLTYESVIGARQLAVWRPLTTAIEHLHHHVPLLAFGVVLFVVALVCLTGADLAEASPRWSNVAILMGAFSTASAIVCVLIWDGSLWLPLLGVTAVAGLVGAAFWRFGLFEVVARGETPHPPDLELRQFHGMHLILRHAHTLRERAMVAIIAFTVLLTSIVGAWYAGAQTASDAATHQAFASEVALNNMNGENWLLASAGAITPTLELFSARMRCAFASQAAVLPPADVAPTAVALLARDRERDCQVLDTDQNKDTARFVDNNADFDSGDGPAVKIFAEFRNRGAANSSHLYALADGYVSLAERWEAKAAMYILGLTLFAIALYLMSQSLAMGDGTPSLVLAVFGSLLAFGTFGYAVRVYGQPVIAAMNLPAGCKAEGTPVEVAATFYGQARTLLDQATKGADYEKAADMFGCVLAARPDFGRAQYDRSRADDLIGQNDIDSRYSNFPTRARMAEIHESYGLMIAALERAGWTPTPRMLNSQGFNAFLAALAGKNLTLVDSAIDILTRGIAAGGLTTADGTLDAVKLASASAADLDLHRMLYTNLGLAYLAKGARPAAEKAYQAAIAGLRLPENRELLASALSDLNTLDAYCAALHGTAVARLCAEIGAATQNVRRMLLVGRVGPMPARRNVRVTDVNAWLRPSRVGWSAQISGFDPARDTLSVVWSSRSADWNVWRVVQPLFKTIDARTLPGSGLGRDATSYDNSPSYCLPAGQYRAEFYVNGSPIDGVEPRVVTMPAFRNYRSREMDVAFCAPEGWHLSSFRQNREGRHLVRAFTTAKGKSALYLFTFFAPRNPLDLETQSPVRRAWSLLKRLTPSPPTDDEFYAAVSRFNGCQNPIDGATILPRVWATPDGLVHVALLMGDAAPGGVACQVLESIGTYYDRR